MPGRIPCDSFVRSIALKREGIPSFQEYPFCIPAIRFLERLELHPRVTFFVGENGTGKSTLLEAVALAAGFNAEGGSRNFSFSTQDTHADLNVHLRLVRGVSRPKDGFFLRAESFYNVATYLDHDASFALDAYGGESLHAQSHGEAFMALLTNRFRGDGLYILDEPEAALSPLRQMAVLPLLKDLVSQRSQFIIATHSPIIMAFPDARIYVLNDSGITETVYEDTEHYRVVRDFLLRKESVLRDLMEDRLDT